MLCSTLYFYIKKATLSSCFCFIYFATRKDSRGSGGERDVTAPSIDVVKKIAEALDVSIDALVFGKQNDTDDIKDKELVSLFKKVEHFNIKNKQTVKDLISAFILKQELKEKLAD